MPDATPATAADVRSILGALDEAKVLAILDLRPTIADLEEAAVRLAGDDDVFGPGAPLRGVAGDIVALLLADEDEELPRPA